MADQGLISGSNFLVSILLARWLPASEYGAFALVFSVFLLLSMLYQCLLLEPMAVFGGGLYRDRLRGYLRSLFWLHVAISVLVASAIGIAAFGAHRWGHSQSLPGALAGIGLSAPCILLLWLARRTFYLESSPANAVAGSGMYCLTILTGLWWVNRNGRLSPFSAFLILGFAALAAATVLLVRLRSAVRPSREPVRAHEIWQHHWSYGKWALASSIASWIPAYIFFPLLGSLSGLAATADLKALLNFAAPLNQAQAAFSTLLLPHVARVRSEGGPQAMSGLAARMTFVALVFGVVYWAGLLVFRDRAFQLLYSGRYAGVSGLLPAVAVGSVLWTATFGFSIVLRGSGSPNLIFVAFSISALISVVAALPLTKALGLRGAIWSINLSDGIALFLLAILLRADRPAPDRAAVQSLRKKRDIFKSRTL